MYHRAAPVEDLLITLDRAGTFLLRYSVAFLEAQSRSRFGSPHLIRSAASARAQSNLGIMRGKVTLQRKGSDPVESESITLYSNVGSGNITFDATFPSCDFRKAQGSDMFAFRYDSTGNDCSLKLWWSKEDFGISKEGEETEVVSSSNRADTHFVLIGDKVKVGNQIKPVCAPRFKDGALLFTVEDSPKYCNATLVFQSDLPPPTPAATYKTVVSTRTTAATTEATTDLSSTSLIIVIVCGSVAGILLLLGLAAFIYWFYKRRARLYPQPSPQSSRQHPPPRKFLPRHRRREKTAIEKEEEMVHDPLDPTKFIAKSENENRKQEEREALETLINRLRKDIVLPWELKMQRKEPLTSQDHYDKEITEAEWRWIHRRNLALQQNEPYDWDKETEEQLKALEEAGREKELREFKTYLSRAALYKRFLNEKDIAMTRFHCRNNGITQPTYADRGCRLTKIENNLQAPLPFPIWVDWPEFQEPEEAQEESK
ncbi:hypothetical protein DdX_15927 [Ditylenchus destructor]|uniref:Uncharacterized protein n=1 Tax=Ditylenchus destructor TaxID=166010 RepID=A0AAD4QXA4_9BILA|nr:hypothetical protein DdX_15927 [Ditylenchus destructor]